MPLARGILAGTYSQSFDKGSTDRSRGQDRQPTEMLYRGPATFDIADRVIELAGKRGVKPAQIAVAWLAGKPGITCPVVGVLKVSQLEDLVAAVDLTLTDDEVEYLEELYSPTDNLLSGGAS